MQSVNDVADLPDGKVDAVGLLYSDDNFEQYKCYPDYNQNCEDVGVTIDQDLAYDLPTWTAKMILPSGIMDYYAVAAGSLMRLRS